MAAPVGFGNLINRKYDIQERQGDAAAELARANAANITAATPFENALRSAQARETNQRAGTLTPLSEASIRQSDAGAREAGARAGYYGAQSGLAGSQSGLVDAQAQAQLSRLSPTPDIANVGLFRTTQQTYAPDGGSQAQVPDNTLQSTYRARQQPGFTATAGAPISGVPAGGLTSHATSGVQDSNLIGGALARGPSSSPVNGQGGIQIKDPNDFTAFNRGTSMVEKPVPAPGQTQTSGTWGSPPNIRQITGITGVPRPTPTPPPAPAYAKGTSKVPHKGAGKHVAAPPMMSPGGPMGAPQGMPSPGQTGPAMPGPMGGPPPGLPGLAGMLQAAMGADQVPGQGNKDTVPAMLTPGEAVVNQGGVSHIPGGRATIAHANAQGNADKAGGRPPGLNRGMVKKPPGHNVAVHIHLH